MSDNVEKIKGEQYVLAQSLLGAVYPILVVLSFSKLSGLISLAWTTVFAAVLFAFIVAYKKSWHYLNNSLFWKYIFGISFFNGFLYFSFYFLGLEKTTPGNASLIGLIEILTSFLFFNLLKKEHISRDHKIGATLMFLGAVIILIRNFSDFNIGDFFVFAGTLCAPFGNNLQQKARKISSTEALLFGRYLVSAPLVFMLAYVLNKNVSFTFTKDSFLFLCFGGFFIFGLARILWVEAIHRIPVTKAIALNSISPLLTLLLAWMILKQTPTVLQLSSLIPLFLGLLLLTDNLKLSKK